MSGFEVFAVPTGAGLLAISPRPVSRRDATLLCAWAPDIVLSLTENPLLRGDWLADVEMAVCQHHIDWLHVPVPDFGVLSVQYAAPLAHSIAVICAVLGRGGRVLIHCDGGCGRSGMVALRVMIAAGEDADSALARLRTARPCAIETSEQLAWATGV